FTAGLLDLYEATGAAAWLREAIALDAVVEKYFEDRKLGGFYFTSDDHETLLAREKPAYDGAEPSGNSVHVMNLLRLSTLTTADRYRRRAVRALGAFRQRLVDNPLALAEMLLALDFYHGVPKEIVIVTPSARAEAEPFLARLRRTYVPNRVLIVTPQGGVPALWKVVPLVEGKTARQGRATAYVCVRGVCDLPAMDPEVFARQISR
ncbi:MAG: thioredoxin domain-containing protein, partial [Bryobacteraceae bacterium]